MRDELVVAPEVEFDVAEGFLWHERRRIGLGEDFLSSVDACVESIRRQPALYAIVHDRYRRALIRRFPYAIFYSWVSGCITIYAIFHTSRDPEKWRQRLP
jgi:plasmid stabilization system protein ParE